MASTRITLLLSLALAGSAWAQEEADVAAGEEVYNSWCVHCHDDNRPWTGGGTMALEFKYRGELPADLRERTDLSGELISAYVRNGLFQMPSFRLTEISDEELEVLVAYLIRNNPE